MYTQFFGLKDKPFAITPDPRYLFMSQRHAEALAHLTYGINEAGGFIQLTGEIGAGKTTLVRALLEQMPPHVDVAVILNPRITPHELLLSVAQEIGLHIPDAAQQSSKALIDTLNAHLLEAHAKGRRVVMIIDEAQALTPETLEQVRLLTNLETASSKLLQILLIGQPELREILASSELKQLAQRITGRYHLEPLSQLETIAYIKHRLKIAGATTDIFTERALREVHRLSHGVPRVINVICDRALLGAYSEDCHRIDAGLVRRAASEVFGRPVTAGWLSWAGGATAVIALGVLGLGVHRYVADPPQPPIHVERPVPVPAPVAQSVTTTAAPLDARVLLDATLPPTSNERAFAILLSLWNAKLEPTGERPCDQAARQGLECVYQKGSWGQLRMLNRPAILTLTDDRGLTHRAVLMKLKDDSAEIDLGEGTRVVTLPSLSRYWLGESLLVWRPQALGQPMGQRSLALGMQGAEVRSLRRHLEMLHGSMRRSAAPEDYFDEELARQVESFQREHRLTVDGIAGVQTQIVLDSILNVAKAPRLMEPETPRAADSATGSGGQTS